jgi:prevent-host-death family protein
MVMIGVRALKQNASAVVARAAQGEVVTITDRGRPVAQLVPLRAGRLAQLAAAGLARPPRRSFRELPDPLSSPCSISEAVLDDRADEHF